MNARISSHAVLVRGRGSLQPAVGAVLLACLVWAGAARANPPGGPGALPQGLPPSKGTPYRGFFSVQGIRKAAGLAAAPGLSAKALGTCRLPVLLVKFQDTPAELLVDPAKVKERFFGLPAPGGPPLASARQYYLDFSDGKLDLDGEVLPWISMDKNQADYLCDNGTLNRAFFTEVIPKAAALAVTMKVDFRKFNGTELKRNDNHEVDCMVILLPAEAQQVSGVAQGMVAYRGWTEWTSASGFDNGQDLEAIEVPGTDVKVSSYCVCSVFKHVDEYLDPAVRQLFDIGTVSHEVLHMFGVCDLYHRNNETFGLGGWCLMGWGLYGAGGNGRAAEDTLPMPPCAWTRKQLILGKMPTLLPVTTSAMGLTMEPASRHGDYYVIPVPVNGTADPTSKNYFLVEFRDPQDVVTGPRKRWNWDVQIPQAGFLIWEADDSVGTWSDFWPYAFDTLGTHGADPGQNDNPSRPMVRLCPADDPQALFMAEASISTDHMWSRPEQVFEQKGVRISHFDVKTRKFDVEFTTGAALGAAAPHAPGAVPGHDVAPTASAPVLSDAELLQRMDGEISRLATIPDAVIDNTPALAHRQELKNLAAAARVPKPPVAVTLSAQTKPVTPQEKALRELAVLYGTTKKSGVTGLVDGLSKDHKFFQLFDLKKPKAATAAEASAALESQFKSALPSMGLPTAVDYQITSVIQDMVQVPGQAAASQASTQSITRRPFIRLPRPNDPFSLTAYAQSMGLGERKGPGKDGTVLSDKNSLPVFGADVISHVNSAGAVSYVRPQGAEVPAPESVSQPANGYTAQEVIDRCKEKFRHLVPSGAFSKWTATQGVDALTKQTVWQVEIPVKGAPSIKVYVETRRPERAADGPKILRAE